MKLVAQPVLKSKAALGEGAIWDPIGKVLNWVDIDNYLIHTFDPASGENSSINVGAPVGTVVKRSAGNGGGFIVGLPEKIAHVSTKGDIEVLCDLEKGCGTRMNDGKCDPAGRFWCGSMDFQFKEGAGNLWMLDEECRLHHKLSAVTISNGIVWSADARTMYYIDSNTGTIDAFDYDIETAAISNRRIAATNLWGGYFDGMTIDSEDNLYVAVWQGGAVRKINSRTGKLLATITVPGVKNITSCAFGGENLDELYITSSAHNADLKDEPNAGALFKLKLTDSHGVPAFEFKG